MSKHGAGITLFFCSVLAICWVFPTFFHSWHELGNAPLRWGVLGKTLQFDTLYIGLVGIRYRDKWSGVAEMTQAVCSASMASTVVPLPFVSLWQGLGHFTGNIATEGIDMCNRVRFTFWTGTALLIGIILNVICLLTAGVFYYYYWFVSSKRTYRMVLMVMLPCGGVVMTLVLAVYLYLSTVTNQWLAAGGISVRWCSYWAGGCCIAQLVGAMMLFCMARPHPHEEQREVLKEYNTFMGGNVSQMPADSFGNQYGAAPPAWLADPYVANMKGADPWGQWGPVGPPPPGPPPPGLFGPPGAW